MTTSVLTVRAVDFDHFYPICSHKRCEPRAVGAGAFNPGPPDVTELAGPGAELAVATAGCGDLEFAENATDMVDRHGNVDLCVVLSVALGEDAGVGLRHRW